MSWRCFAIYPLPRVADESFLQLVFDGSVARSVFLGSNPRRFALVELRDDVHTDAVLRAIGDASPLPSKDSVIVAHGCGDDGDEEDDVDRMLTDMFNTCEDKLSERRKSAHNASGTHVAKMVCIPHLGRLRFHQTPLRVVRSPITISELYSCGGEIPRNRTDRRFVSKRPRSAALGADTAPSSDRTAVTGTSGGENNTAVAEQGDLSRHCGSTEHLTQHCAATAAAGRDDVIGHDAPQATKRNRDKTKGKFPANCCQKCGSSAHFTRHCDVEYIAEGPAAGEQRREYKQEPKRPQTAVSVSKDQCKHCGSNLHLSRHCPSK